MRSDPPGSGTIRALTVACAALLALAGCAAGPDGVATVGLGEWFVGVSEAVDAGTVTLDVRNDGAAHHNLTICPSDGAGCEGPAVTQRVLVAPDDAREPEDFPSATTSLVLGAGWETTVEVDLEPGTYRFYCAVVGHADRGMDTVVEVGGGTSG